MLILATELQEGEGLVNKRWPREVGPSIAPPDPERHPDRVVVVLALAAGPLIALGLARFAYALLLPPMREELHWTYSQAGALNTSNAAGYLVGALVAASLAGRIQTRRAFVLRCVVATLSLLVTPLTTFYPLLLLIRFVAGLREPGRWSWERPSSRRPARAALRSGPRSCSVSTTGAPAVG